VQGGDGADGGRGNRGLGGVGGIGVVGSGLSIVNSGSIAGGLAGDGTTRANAVSLTGSGNRFESHAGSSTLGDVEVTPGDSSNLLALDGSTNGTFDASKLVDIATPGATDQFVGFGAFEKSGSSTWELAGSAIFAGPITVTDGTLLVHGSTASSSLTRVNDTATLGGSGTVGNTTIMSGGILAPGNSIGTLTVAGDLLMSAGSIYEVEIAGNGDRDRVNVVGGTATVTGANVEVVALDAQTSYQDN